MFDQGWKSAVAYTCGVALLSCATPLFAQDVDRARGRDARVDYPALKQLGPWDDRNYSLTQADLAYLAPNEHELHDPIPAFYRVELRRQNPDLLREGPSQYPRSALNRFVLKYGGYLYQGKLYRGLRRGADGRLELVLEKGISQEAFEAGEVPEPDALSGEVRVSSPTGGAETAVKIHPADPNRAVAGSNGPGSGQIMWYSTNGGSTWSAAAALPLGSTCCDPTVDWSSNGQYAYAATLGSAGGVWVYRSSNGGQSWSDLGSDPRREVSSAGGDDKEYLHVDKFATSPFKDNVYITWHTGNVLKFSRSTDFGQTWSAAASLSGSGQSGIGSDIVSDKNGNVYYFWPATSAKTILMRKSTNGGGAFNAAVTVANTQDGYDFAIPAMDVRRAFIYVSADADLTSGPFANRIYAAWTDSTAPESGTTANNHARIQVGRSSDGGATWQVTTPHETADANSVDRFHPWLSVGPDGKVYVIFYDTRRVADRTGVDLFYSVSSDGGVTFGAPQRLTSTISPQIEDNFEWGDYNGLDVVMNQLIGIYTDNRNEGGGAADSVDAYAVGLLVGGPPTPDFAVTCSPASLSAAAGGSATSTCTVTSTNGFNSAVSLSCAGAPAGVSCAYAPASVTPPANGSVNSTLTVSVAAGTAAGTSTFQARGTSGATTRDASITLTITGTGGGAQTATYDSVLRAPKCATVGISCDSGASLLLGRSTKGPEPNQPNTINATCADGTSGTFHVDESNDRLKVSTVGGGNLVAGQQVRIDATVWAWSTPSADKLDLYYAANANSPAWTFIGTLTPTVAGAQTLSATYTLPAGTLQAVRAQFRYQGTAGTCSTGSYNDRDDLIFAVQ